MAEAVFVRSPVAHARITGIDLDGARTDPAVLDVVTAADLDGVARYPHLVPWMKDVDSFPLARDRVRYVGMPVVAVLAEDRYVAEDAAGSVVVDYDELPVLVTVEEALADDAPRLYDDWPDNKLMDLPVTQPEVDKVFAEHDVVRTTFRMQRQSPSPMETRGIVAELPERPADGVGIGAEPAHPAHHPGDDARAQGSEHQGHRPERRRRVRLQAPPVHRGHRRAVAGDAHRPAGPLDRGPGRAPHDLDPRPRAADGRGGGLRQRRAHPGRARHHRHQRRLR